MADLVVRYTHQKMAAYVGQGWVSLKCSHFPLLFCPKLYVQLFISAFLPHAAVWAVDHIWDWSMPLWENPHPNFNLNLILMWQALIVNGFWWNFNMLFILVLTNSLAKLFEINQSLLNCCVVKIFAFVHSKSCSAPQCGEYLRDLALFDQLLYDTWSSEQSLWLWHISGEQYLDSESSWQVYGFWQSKSLKHGTLTQALLTIKRDLCLSLYGVQGPFTTMG